eukprot:11989613-Ditylum_brightwellii.AAC.1
MHHINATWQTTASGCMENVYSSKWWTGWVQHCMVCSVDCLLRDIIIHKEKLTSSWHLPPGQGPTMLEEATKSARDWLTVVYRRLPKPWSMHE